MQHSVVTKSAHMEAMVRQATANTLRASRANALSVLVCVMVLSGERCVWCGLSVV